jgi:hypothetical protein
MTFSGPAATQAMDKLEHPIGDTYGNQDCIQGHRTKKCRVRQQSSESSRAREVGTLGCNLE